MKKLISLIMVFCILFAFCGCNADGKDFFSVMFNENFKSYASTGTMEIELTSKVPEEVKEELKPFNIQSLLNALSDLKLAWGETTYTDENIMKSKMSFGVSAPDFSFTANACGDLSDGNFTVLFDIPTIFKTMLPEEFENGKTAYLDFNELTELSESLVVAFDYSDTMKKSYEIRESSMKFLLDFAGFIRESGNIIKKSGQTYTVSISDKQLKSIINDSVTAYMTNENARNIVNNYVGEVFAVYKDTLSEEIYNESFGMIYEELCSVTSEELAIAYEEFKTVWESVEKIRFLGEKGITLNYTVDKNGFITNSNGVFDFIIDISNIAAVFNAEFSSDFYIEGTIKYNQDITDINLIKPEEIININKNDSVSVIKWLKAYQPSYEYEEPVLEEYEYEENHIMRYTPEPDGTIAVFDYDFRIDFGDFKPILKDNTLYVPLEQFLGYYYGEDSFFWDSETREMVISTYNENTYRIKPDSNIIDAGSYSIMLSKNVILIDGFMYVPLRSFAEAVFGYYVHWDGERRFAGLAYGPEYYEYMFVDGEIKDV